MITKQLMFTNGGQLISYKDCICQYCGKPFLKKYRTEKYCSDECRTLALQDQKAEYQRKRRKQIKEGVLVSNENNHIGTNFLSEHPHTDEDGDVDEEKEYDAIQKELKRLKLE